MSASIRHLEWDSEHFDVKCGKIELHDTSGGKAQLYKILAGVLAGARDQGYRFLWTKTPSMDYALNHTMEDVGFRLMDCELTLVHSGNRPAEAKASRFHIKRLSNSPLPELEPLGDVFINTRFHADPNIPDEKVREFWRKSVVNAPAGFADEVFVAFDGERPVGIVSCVDCAPADKTAQKLVRTFFHVGVASDLQGCGIGQEMIKVAINDSLDRLTTLRVETQSSNVAALNVYQRCGFGIAESHYAFHLWL